MLASIDLTEYLALQTQRDELVAVLRDFLEHAQCGCTVAERYSGHLLGCEMQSLMERADEVLSKYRVPA